MMTLFGVSMNSAVITRSSEPDGSVSLAFNFGAWRAAENGRAFEPVPEFEEPSSCGCVLELLDTLELPAVSPAGLEDAVSVFPVSSAGFFSADVFTSSPKVLPAERYPVTVAAALEVESVVT